MSLRGTGVSGVASITGGNTQFSTLTGGIAMVKAPSGTMANNGAITLGTALPVTYAEGCYMWLPAGAVAAGVPAAASWLWCVMSSTTVGTVFNSTYTSGLPATGVQTAFVTTGPGAFTGDTGGSIVALSYTAAALGVNGRLEYNIGWTMTNSATAKAIAVRYVVTNIATKSVTTQNALVSFGYMQNRGRTDKQVTGQTDIGAAGTGSDGGQIGVDTSIPQTVSVVLAASGVATDFAIINDYSFRVLNP
jgi:hypothetical protein